MEIKKINSNWKNSCYIKTLIVPKMNHLIFTLPNPDYELIQKLDKALFNYLWGSDIHKI